MSQSTLIALAFLSVFVAFLCAAIWQFSNVRGLRSRGLKRSSNDRSSSRKPKTRKSDRRKLTRAERKMYTEAKRLLAAKKIPPAARILEQLNMPREAIQALEDAGLIHEAAKILTRMQRPNRAGVIYARHGMWDHAAQAFKMANMPVEVAKCAREAGDYDMAAEHFRLVDRHEDAASCYEAAGNIENAARYYLKAGNANKALPMFEKIIKKAPSPGQASLEKADLEFLVEAAKDGYESQAIIDVLAARNKLVPLISGLIGKGMIRQAAMAYKRAVSDIGPSLMSEVGHEETQINNLADVFNEVDQIAYAGMLYERMAEFQKAGEAFERAGEFERAIYCYDRAGLGDRVQKVKELAAAGVKGGKQGGGSPGASNQSPFALGALTGVETPDNDIPAAPQFGDGNMEKTEVLTSEGSIPPPPPEASITFDADDDSDDGADLPPPPPRGFGDGPPLEPITEDSVADSEPTPVEPIHDGEGSAVPAGFTRDAITSEPASESDSDNPQAEGRFSLSEAEQSANQAQPEVSLGANQSQDEPAKVLTMDAPSSGQEPAAGQEYENFRRASFIGDLDRDQKEKVWQIGQTLEFSADEVVLTYNDEPAGVYVIIKGEIACYRMLGEDDEQFVDEMEEGESFGELWLLADQPTAVKFVANGPTRLRVIPRDAFVELLDKDGTIARKVYKRFTLRLLKRLIKPRKQKKNLEAS